MLKMDIIAGARPNFMKIAPIIDAIEEKRKAGFDIKYRLVHTGQHYDKNMNESFFDELGIPKPSVNLECGGGTQAEQTANIMTRFEKDLIVNPCDIVIVVGDVTSTLACSIVAKKLHTKVAHVEAGIRSGDIRMPEEINRMVTDAITDYFFTTSEVANQNLLKAGICGDRIFFVGNTMIDTLQKQMKNFRKPLIWEKARLKERHYIIMTLHRPANVDEESNLKNLIGEVIHNSKGLPIIFPVHPRTSKTLMKINILSSNLYLIDPLGYLEFNYLVQNSKAVITDSGGITEETTVMGVPCMTLRDNTERPETVAVGTNKLLGVHPRAVKPAMEELFSGKWKKGGIPKFWDGNAAKRIIDHLTRVMR